MSRAAYFTVLSGDEAICSFILVRDTGRIFLIWVMILELFQKLEMILANGAVRLLPAHQTDTRQQIRATPACSSS